MPTASRTFETEGDVARAASAIRAHYDGSPKVGLVLGSGLGALADTVENPAIFPANELPGYPQSTVSGHQGRLVLGKLEGVEVAFVQGRLHLYEGYPLEKVTFPVQLLHALGAPRLLVTNAAGGINRQFKPGVIMLIADHISNATPTPIPGTPPVGYAPSYDLEWLEQAEAHALALGLDVRRGVYVWVTGPTYETPAEIRAYRSMGADAVGMSTVPEVIHARRLGMKVLGLSTITNLATDLSPVPLAHEDVLAVGKRVRVNMETLVRRIIADLAVS